MCPRERSLTILPCVLQGQLGHLLEAIGEAASQLQLQKSVKLVKLLTSVIQTYPHMLGPHVATLQKAATRNSSFMAKGLQDRVEKLLTPNL
jgi:hypothetical protein